MADEKYGPGSSKGSYTDLDKDTSQGKMADVNRITDAINKELLDESKGSTIAQMIQFSIALQYRKQIAERSGGEIEEGIQYRDYLLKIRDRFTNLQSLEQDEEVKLRVKAIVEIITDMNAMLPAIDDKLADRLRFFLEEFQGLIVVHQQDEGEPSQEAPVEIGSLPEFEAKEVVNPEFDSRLVGPEIGHVTVARMATSGLDVPIYVEDQEPPTRVQARRVLEQPLPPAPQPRRLREDFEMEEFEEQALEEGEEMELLPLPVPESVIADFQGPPPAAKLGSLPQSVSPIQQASSPELVMAKLIDHAINAEILITDFQDPNDCSEQILRNQENQVISYLMRINQELSNLMDHPHTTDEVESLTIDLKTLSERILANPFSQAGKETMAFFKKKLEAVEKIFEGEITDVKSLPLLSGDEFETVRKEKWPWSPEKNPIIMEARNLIKKKNYNDEREGMKILRKNGFVATARYDEIHKQETHNFSKNTLEQPNRFAKRFVERTMRSEKDDKDDEKPLGKDSVVLDIGCGMGADSVHFAKQGATVIALDSSPYAIEKLKRTLALYQKLGKMIEQFSTEDYFFDDHDNTIHLSERGIKKLRRLMPPYCSEAIIEMNKLLDFYSKEYAITKTKTNASESLENVDSRLKDNLILYPEWDEEKTREIRERTGKMPGVVMRIRPAVGEISESISNLMSRQFTHVFENSSGHYDPPYMTRVLEGQKGTLLAARQGWYGKAMKTDKSRSASVGKDGRNYSLTKDDGYNYRLDKEDRVPRLFPTEKNINLLVEDTGVYDIRDGITVTVKGYDREGEKEEFRYIIAKHLGGKKMI